MRVLCLSGGGFKGAYQVPIIEELMSRHDYDLILGVSVGSLNGALASQGDFSLMKEFWNNIDTKVPFFGIKNFLAWRAYRMKGWFGLDPVEELLKQHVSLDKMTVPYGCGVVARENSKYYTLYANEIETDKELRTAILGSSSIAFLMEPVKMMLNGRQFTLSDGSHRHVLPTAPMSATHVDAVFCNPITPNHKDTHRIDRIFEALSWMLDIQVDNYTFSDFKDLKMRCLETGMTADVYAPRSAIGSVLSADQETIQKWIAEGLYTVKHPIGIR